jgi:cytochrome c oxidase subunit I
MQDAHPGWSNEARAARQWLLVAVSVLILAGGFALLLVAGRMPPFDTLFTDPLFFKRALVVHVNLALVFWFFSFAAALMFLLPGQGRSSRWSRHSPRFAWLGVGIMAVSVVVPGTEPVLSNYIPMIDHPLFAAGQATFALGILTSFFDKRMFIEEDEHEGFLPLPEAVQPALRALGIAILLAAFTFVASYLTRPQGASLDVFYELLFWGTGHMLQLASTVAMLVVWLLLLGGLTSAPVLSKTQSGAMFFALVTPWTMGPLLGLYGTTTGLYRVGFTFLMRFSIFPVVLLFLVVAWRAVRAAPPISNRWRDPRYTGLVSSVALTLLGFVLGAMITGSDTTIPAHYHASLGGVTVAFMAGTYMLLEPLGLPIPARFQRVAGAQPLVFAGGQMVFAGGFAAAGAMRKVYGAEQSARGLVETMGLSVMGLGGLMAVVGGVMFLVVVVAAWSQATSKNLKAWRFPWRPENRPTNIPFKG